VLAGGALGAGAAAAVNAARGQLNTISKIEFFNNYHSNKNLLKKWVFQ